MLRKFFDKQEKLFAKGGPLEKLHPLYEALDTGFYSPPHVTRGASHVRDALDLKRMMSVVLIALIPCIFMALYNTGLQASEAYLEASRLQQGTVPIDNWHWQVFGWLGLDHTGFLGRMVLGAIFFLPVYAVTMAVGGTWEVLFAVVRRHEVNEGFFVTGMLFPLILPPTIPLWQVAIGISFGVVLGKEVFGGTGMNIFNPALMARAFLFFAYPAQISGDKVWVGAPQGVDAYSSATMLARAMNNGKEALLSSHHSWMDAFLGFIPGSMGETSALACLIGAVILIITGVGSWRIMVGVLAGSTAASFLLNGVHALIMAGDPDPTRVNLYLNVPIWWHLVLGGWAFGTVFMATDPVSSSQTETGKWVYGLLIGILAILIRVVNPGYPEGIMLAILFMNVFAAAIDHVVVRGNIKRRLARHAATV